MRDAFESLRTYVNRWHLAQSRQMRESRATRRIVHRVVPVDRDNWPLFGDIRVIQNERLLCGGTSCRFRACRAPSSRSRSNSAAGSWFDELELVDDFAGGLFFFDLFLDEPLELHQRRELLLVERQFPQSVDLLRDGLLLGERLLEHLRDRVELDRRLEDRLQDRRGIADRSGTCRAASRGRTPRRSASSSSSRSRGTARVPGRPTSRGSCTTNTARC